jgi:hypothetical protein
MTKIRITCRNNKDARTALKAEIGHLCETRHNGGRLVIAEVDDAPGKLDAVTARLDESHDVVSYEVA